MGEPHGPPTASFSAPHGSRAVGLAAGKAGLRPREQCARVTLKIGPSAHARMRPHQRASGSREARGRPRQAVSTPRAATRFRGEPGSPIGPLLQARTDHAQLALRLAKASGRVGMRTGDRKHSALRQPSSLRRREPGGQALDEPVLDPARGHPCGVCDRNLRARAVRDHDEPAQAEQVSAAVRVGVQTRAEPRAAGRMSRPPSRARLDAEISSRSAPSTLRIVPSRVFSATLPVKPSQTTTSASPSSSARPSVLPSKRTSASSSSACVSSVSWFPSRLPRRSRGA